MNRNIVRAGRLEISSRLTAFFVLLAFTSTSLAQALTVPAYNSLPSATAKLFLDFDGVDFGNTIWGSSGQKPGKRPAYDIDGNPNAFSSAELSNIFEIWSRVTEAYSPYNINVTTVDPGNYNWRESAHVVISGGSDWYGSGLGGVAKTSGFTSLSSPAKVRRTSWVFPNSLWNGDPKLVADASIHEAGHMFGLEHQPVFDASGTIVDNYDNGDAFRAPNMGTAYSSQRGLWSIGPDKENGPKVDTNEMNVIGALGGDVFNGFKNDFGFIPDETGTNFDTAPLINLSSIVLRGVIGNVTTRQSYDIDYFRLNVPALSQVNINVDVAQFGPMLDTKLTLFDSTRTMFYVNDPPLDDPFSRDGLTSSYSGMLEAGTYFLAIGSHGGFAFPSPGGTVTNRYIQDTGQYFLTGSIVSIPEPTGLALVGIELAVLPMWNRQRSRRLIS